MNERMQPMQECKRIEILPIPVMFKNDGFLKYKLIPSSLIPPVESRTPLSRCLHIESLTIIGIVVKGELIELKDINMSPINFDMCENVQIASFAPVIISFKHTFNETPYEERIDDAIAGLYRVRNNTVTIVSSLGYIEGVIFSGSILYKENKLYDR